MFRRHKRFRGPRKKRYWIITILSLFIVGLILLFELQVESTLLKLAKSQVKNISQEAVSKGIQDMRRSMGADLNKMMSIKTANGRVQYVHVDSEIQAKVYDIASHTIQKELKKLEHKDNAIPLGSVLQSSLFSDVGPDVPLQIWPKGSTRIEMISTMKEKGINTVQVTLYLHITNELSILVPANNEDEIKIDYRYPIAWTTIPGDVPDNYYYYNNEGDKEGMEGPVPVVPTPPQKE
ncbi:sporulation protein YunB [Melghirimyces algeriensis]|uniref:Sporulation protein YunB n=1 Tax=Melghirimyces algeriensis TaxID=910412 RepID=A0A521CD66_9BACL|nr:sporulation protein YunB [Melghirimyces algeriensis]SMO57325.1 sporulation protein YunB [Melghirimyces algeriensis]